jgi:hypothetical protein
MLRRRFALLLFLYVSLEFANPFMPGAVTFEGGSMEAARAERHRPAACPPLAASPEGPVPTVLPKAPSPPTRISAAPRRPIPTVHHDAPPLDQASPVEDD